MPGTPLGADARTFAAGTPLGRYVIGPRLARGGMAELYLARATGPAAFDKRVAIKLVLPHLKHEPDFIRMFMHEARVAGGLDHPNIVSVFDLGFADGEYYIAMEHVHGRDLRAILRDIIVQGDEADLPWPVALGIVEAIALGLHHAHEAVDADGHPLGIVHRDVSPGNVMVRYDGLVKLADFGIAKAAHGTNATRTGAIKGKPGYMSPEQCLARAIDRRSDIFNLGILLYELTTRRRLFVADSDFTVLNQIIKGSFPRPSEVVADYPRAVERVVMHALQVDPNRRPATAAAFAAELRALPPHLRPCTSAAAIGAWMQGCYGHPAAPTFELEVTDVEAHGATATVAPIGAPAVSDAAAVPLAAVAVAAAPARRRTPLVPIVAAAAAAFVFGGLAWERARSSVGVELVASLATLADPPPPQPRSTASPPTPRATPPSDPAPAPSVAVAPAPSEEATPTTPELAVVPEPAPATRSGRRKKTRPAQPSASKAETKTAADPWRDMLPPSMRSD